MGLVENLVRRAEILRSMRAFFDGRGFTEVTTPVRIAAPAPEPHIDCPPCGGRYLRASPELQMKKLLAAGMDRIYEIGPCFREAEFGDRHNPEFTMIEWYRRGADYSTIREDMVALLSELSGAQPAGFRTFAVRDAYREYAGWDPWTEWNQDRFDYDMATKVEPSLPMGYVFLTDYPSAAASLSKLRGDVAERWELYFDGVELANCFTELCDAEEQRRRFLSAKAERAVLGEGDYPIDEDFLGLLPLVGSASGVALGIDRLVAVLCGEHDIHAVMAGE